MFTLDQSFTVVGQDSSDRSHHRITTFVLWWGNWVLRNSYSYSSMGIYNNLLLGLCTLHILTNCSPNVTASRRPRTSAANRYSILASLLLISYGKYLDNCDLILRTCMHVLGASGAERRRARAVDRPIPVDCKMGSWSSWTPCNACTDKKVLVFFFK